MLTTALCMPVGPAGIKAEVCQLVTALVRSGRVQHLILASGHLIRARNTCYAAIERDKTDRVLWLDSDVWTDLDAYARFVDRANESFDSDPHLGWYGAICMRRGEERLVNFAQAESHWRAGLGLAYWHAPRVMASLGVEPPFRWIEPLSEDYRLCDDLYDRGILVKIDCRLQTHHVDVGTWPGEYQPGFAVLEQEIEVEEGQMEMFRGLGLPGSGAV